MLHCIFRKSDENLAPEPDFFLDNLAPNSHHCCTTALVLCRAVETFWRKKRGLFGAKFPSVMFVCIAGGTDFGAKITSLLFNCISHVQGC